MTSSAARDMAELLEMNDIGLIGEDIFIGLVPLDNENISIKAPDKVIGVFDNGEISSLNTWQRDEKLVRFQIRSTPFEYDEGYDLANEIKEAVLGCANININDKDYILFNLVGGINHLGMDLKNRHMFSLNIRVVVQNFPNSSRLPF